MAEQITLSEAKLYMRIDDDYEYDDAVITLLITAQRTAMEYDLELSLVPKTGLVQTYIKTCCGVCHPINILYGPVTSSVIKDKDGNVIDPVPTNIGTTQFPRYKFNQTVTVTYDAGYAIGELPEDLKLAMLMNIATAYENRENGTNGTVNSVLNSSCKLSRQHSRNVF